MTALFKIVFAPVSAIPESEIEFTAIRAQGAGGQNVNKVSNAIHLRFDIRSSSLSEHIKERLLELNDHRVNSDGVVVIKAQAHRSLERNKEAAMARLQEMVDAAATPPKARTPTRPTRGAQQRRLKKKSIRGEIKTLRGKVPD